jgi:hypothetical protein
LFLLIVDDERSGSSPPQLVRCQWGNDVHVEILLQIFWDRVKLDILLIDEDVPETLSDLTRNTMLLSDSEIASIDLQDIRLHVGGTAQIA